ncbi:hypothetical protein M2103_000965 [Ereboglobus sp. PH5-5]|uniref:hypothetical protein n=1 Tax=Ereboglobus sp. PH5-5 TaxID=2940529 RepID=UPI0024059137|nr:hypothetical protein [Ereboglobus sp. PH5-5]MDF9832751.1 hypothetical protein [Ereboglobus sp. PH5-5]
MPSPILIPKTLTKSNWDKNKGLMAKLQGATGIGPAMEKLDSAHTAIDWSVFTPRATRDWTDALIDDLKKRADTEAKKIKPLAAAAQALVTTASKTESDWKKSKTIPKKSLDLIVAIKADALKLVSAITAYNFMADISKLKPGASAALQIDGITKFERNYGDIGKKINDATKSKVFTLPPSLVVTYISMPDMGGKENAYITAVISDAMGTAVTDTIRDITNIITNADKVLPKFQTDARVSFTDKVKKTVESKLDALYTQLDKIPQEKWREFTAAKKQYKAYKLESKKKVAKSGLGVALSALKFAGASGPAAIAGAIVGTLTGLAKLGAVLYSLGKEVESSGKSVTKTAAKLLAKYQTAAKKEAYLNLAIDTLDIPLLDTARKLKDEVELWDNKTAGLHYNAAKAAKALPPLMESNLEFSVNGGDPKAMAKLEAKLDALLEKIISLSKRYSKNKSNIKKCAPAVEIILKKDKEVLGKLTMLPEIVNLVTSVVSLKDAEDMIDVAQGLIDLKDNISDFKKAAKEA